METAITSHVAPSSVPLAPGGSANKLDLETLVLLASLERHELLEDGVRAQMKDIEAKNAKYARLRKAIADLRNNQPWPTGKSVSIFTATDEVRQLLKECPDLKPKNLLVWKVSGRAFNRDFHFNLGISIDCLGGSAHAKLMENVQTALEVQTSTSQTDMLRLQSTMTKDAQIMEMASTVVKKASDVHQNIIRNL